MNLKDIGFTKEELQNRVVDQICTQVMQDEFCDDEGNSCPSKSTFARKLSDEIKKRIDAAVAKIADKHVMPGLTKYIESITFDETNRWGERVKKPAMTFREYLIERMEAYMRDPVNHNGKTEKEDSYSFRPVGTRIQHAVNENMASNMKRAMEETLKRGHDVLKQGIEDALKIRLKQLFTETTVEVKVKNS